MELLKEESTALTAEDLQTMSNVPITFTTYDELPNTTLANLLQTGAAIILMNIHGDGAIAPVGHWIALLMTPDGLEHFDSYGLTLDQELSVTHEEKFLSQMLADVSIVQSTFRYQEFRHEVNTCGRHCVVRCMLRDKTNNAYKKMMLSMPAKPDPVVTLMTFFRKE